MSSSLRKFCEAFVGSSFQRLDETREENYTKRIRDSLRFRSGVLEVVNTRVVYTQRTPLF